MPRYSGGCHCGAIRFRVDDALAGLIECNCSVCQMTAYIHWEVDPDRFSLERGDDAYADYQFGTMTSHNFFCRTCGISPFRRSRTAPEKIDINVRCLEGIDLDTLEIGSFDGVHWEETMARR